MTTMVEQKEFDAAIWEVTPGTREPEAIVPIRVIAGADVLRFIAVGAMLLSLGVINTGWVTIATVGVMSPVIITLVIGLALLAIQAVVVKRIVLAGALGFVGALGLTYVLLGAPNLSAFGDPNITQALGMTFMIWAIVGALIALALLPQHFFMAVVLAVTDVALWIVMASYLASGSASATAAGYTAVAAAGLAFLVGLVGIVWPKGIRWIGGSLRVR